MTLTLIWLLNTLLLGVLLGILAAERLDGLHILVQRVEFVGPPRVRLVGVQVRQVT